MAQLISDGPRGVLGATHRFVGRYGEVRLGAVEGATEQVFLETIDGLFASAQANEARSDRAAGYGSNVQPRIAKSKTVTYEGTVEAKTLDGLGRFRGACARAFGDLDFFGTMYIEDELGWLFRARVLTYSSSDEQTTGPNHVFPFQRAFSLALELRDPRTYLSTSAQVNYPGDAAQTCENLGSQPTLPYIEVEHGGTGNLIVRRVSPEPADLVFSSLLPAGRYALDFFGRRVVALTGPLAGRTVTGYLSAASGWWDAEDVGLHPGENVVRLFGPGFVRFQHATI